METHRFVLLGITFCAFGLPPIVSRCGAQGERTALEVRDKCIAFRQIAKAVQGSEKSNAIFRSKADGDQTTKYHNDYKQNQRCVLMIERLEQNNRRTEMAYVINPKYGFTLARNLEKKEWVLRDLFLGDPSKVTYGGKPLRDRVLSTMTLAYPSELIEGWKVRENGDAKAEMVVLEYEQPGSRDAPGDSKGIATFQRSNALALVSLEDHLTLKGMTGASKIRLDYQGELKGFARLAKRRSETTDKELDGSVSTSETVEEYDLTYDENVPDTEFTLTAFGLPEPKGITWERPAERGWMWWGLAGLILMAAGYAAYRWRRAGAKPAAA